MSANTIIMRTCAQRLSHQHIHAPRSYGSTRRQFPATAATHQTTSASSTLPSSILALSIHYRLFSSLPSATPLSYATHPPSTPVSTPTHTPSAVASSSSSVSSSTLSSSHTTTSTPPPVTTPPLSDEGAPFEFAKETSRSPSSFPRNITLLVLFGGFCYHVYSQRNEFVEETNEKVIGCYPQEIHDLINVFHFNTKDMESIYAKTMQRSVQRLLQIRGTNRQFERAHTDCFYYCFFSFSSLLSHPRGFLTLEDFSTIVSQQASVVKHRRALQRTEREKERAREQYFDDRAEVVVEREIKRAQQANAPQATIDDLQDKLTSLIATNVQREQSREKQAAADVDEAAADAHKDNQFVPIDIYTFFRTTPSQRRWIRGTGVAPMTLAHVIDVRELFTGLANVIFDHAELEARYEERKDGKNIPDTLLSLQSQWTGRDIEVFTRSPDTKLHFVWRLTDEDRDGLLTLAQVERMVERMIRTGHVTPESLRVRDIVDLHATSSLSTTPSTTPTTEAYLVPYHYRTWTPREIAEAYWKEISYRRRVEAMKKYEAEVEKVKQSNSGNVSSIPLPSLPSPSYHPELKLTWPEFRAASERFTHHRGPIGYWYLTPTYPNGTTMGTMAKWRRRREEKLKDLWENVPIDEEAKQIDRSIQTFLV